MIRKYSSESYEQIIDYKNARINALTSRLDKKMAQALKIIKQLRSEREETIQK